MKSTICSVVFVTHNSEKFMPKAMECLQKQTLPATRIVIVDSGSTNTDYLKVYEKYPEVVIHLASGDIGFCKGNNLGMGFIHPESEFVLFLNPDAFLNPYFIEQAVEVMQRSQNKRVAMLTGVLLGYDIACDKPTGKYDSTGIFRTWYGQWYDRAQAMPQHPADYQKHEHIPAICGALMFCRKKALDEILLRSAEVFDSNFYMYKEDIDLSVRLRKKGWKLLFAPEIIAYHCRGWKRDRKQMPRLLRLCSAKNEFRINFGLKSPIGSMYSALKYCLVRFGDL